MKEHAAGLGLNAKLIVWTLANEEASQSIAFIIFFVQAYRLSLDALKYETWKNHIATLGTLGVLYSLLVVEGQGAHP